MKSEGFKTKTKFNQIHEEERYYQQKINMLTLEINEKKKILKNYNDYEKNNFFVKNISKEEENNLKIWENFLNKKTVKYSSQKSSNNTLINDINKLRKEKELYLNMHKNLEEELGKFIQQIKKKRDKYKELTKYNEQLKEFEKNNIDENKENFENFRLGFQTINNQIKSHLLKSKKIKNNNTMTNYHNNSKNLHRHKTVTNNDRMDNLININDKDIYGNLGPMNKPAPVNRNNPASILENSKYLKDKIQAYENLSNEIKMITNKENFGDIINYYKNLKKDNNSLYNESQRLIEEIRHQKEIKVSLQIQENQIKESKLKKNSAKTNLIDEYENKILNINNKIDFLDKKSNELSQNINLIKIGIPIILERINFKDDKNNNFSNKKISNEEILNMLNLIELRTNEWLKIIDEENLTEFRNIKFEDNLKNLSEDQKYREYQDLANSLILNENNPKKNKNKFLENKANLPSLENLDLNINKKNDQFLNKKEFWNIYNENVKKEYLKKRKNK